MAETETKPSPAFTRDELQHLADEMTMGDVWRSQKESPDNRAEVGMRAFWHSALRLEVIAKDVPFDAFIDRVKSDDFRAVNQPGDADAGKEKAGELKPG